MSKNEGWTPSSFLLAQMVHFFVAVAVIFGFAAFQYIILWGWGFILVIALVKETVFDQVVEKNPFFWSGATDWFFYLVGCVVATLILILTNTSFTFLPA
jgi:hypothetical protein